MEIIKIAWLRDGVEAMAFEKPVADPEEAMELFNRLSDLLHHWWTRQAAEGKEG